MHIYTNESEKIEKINAITMTLTTCNQEQYTSKTYISSKNTFTIYAAKLQNIYITICIDREDYIKQNYLKSYYFY